MEEKTSILIVDDDKLIVLIGLGQYTLDGLGHKEFGIVYRNKNANQGRIVHEVPTWYKLTTQTNCSKLAGS